MFLPKEDRSPCIRENSSGLDDASKLLLKAAALLEERGWCQNKLETPSGNMCAIGAIHNAAGRPVADKDDCEPFYRAQKRMEGHVGQIPLWNDNPFRTKEEVVAKLRAVALGG